MYVYIYIYIYIYTVPPEYLECGKNHRGKNVLRLFVLGLSWP